MRTYPGRMAAGLAIAIGILAGARAQAGEEGGKQVRIESRFVQIDDAAFLRAASEAGLKLTAGLSKPSVLAQGGDAAGLERLAACVSKDKGADFLSAPTITCKSGEKASIRLIQEFFFKKRWDSSGNPSEWGKEEVGVTIDVTPQVEGSTIELLAAPRIVEFQGFRTNRLEPRSEANASDKPIDAEQPVFGRKGSWFTCSGAGTSVWAIAHLEPSLRPGAARPSATAVSQNELPVFVLLSARVAGGAE